MPSNFYHRSAEIDLTWSGGALSADDLVSVRVDRQLLRYLGRKDGGAKMGRWDDDFLLRTADHLSDDFTIKVERPVITIAPTTANTAVTEGGIASFTVTAEPAPTSPLTVPLNVADAADSDFVLAAHEGAKTVTIPTGGTATYTVATDNGHSDTDEPNGAVTVTVNEDTADPDTYTVGSTATASVAVRDNDETTVTLARSGGSGAIAEGGSATLTVTLGRALVAGEEITAPLTVSGEGIAAGDYTVALDSGASLNRGVTLNTSNPHSAALPAVVFAGHGTQTVQVATLTLTAVNDEVDEGVSETLTVGFGSGNRAVMSNLDRASGTGTGGTAASGTVAVEITDNDTAATTLVLTPATIDESGAGNASTVTATLSRASSVATTLTVSATAVAPAVSGDFTVSANKTLTIAAGAKASTGVVTITAVDNKVDAANKKVTVSAVASGGHGLANPGNQELTITDDDERGITFDPEESVSVIEEGSGSYTVVLDTQPTEAVTVTITSDNGDLTIADTDSVMQGIQNTLTFNPTGVTKLWNVAQTVTVNAAADDDTANDAVMLTHAASGGDYASVSEDLAVTITDNDVPALVITPKSLTVAEGSSSGSTNTYTVRLATEPTADVTVTIGSDNADVTLDGPDSATAFTASETLTFSASGANLWSTAQTVTVSAAQDTDVSDDEATLTHTASDTGGYDDVTADLEVTVTDDDEPEITIARSGGSGAITEGDTATFTVTANPVPAGNLVVTLNVADVEHADYLAPGNQGTKTVTVPVGGSVDYDVVTTGGNSETTDEPDGEITVTVNAGTGYTVSNTNGSETVEVEDDDATTVTLTTPTATATEDSSTATARLVLTLGRALRSGEVLAVPLGFSGGALNTDFTLALTTAATGVGLSGSTVTFTGSDAGSATVATVTLTASHDADAEDESITVTIPASHTGNAPILTATNLSGGAAGSRVGNGVITVSDDEERGITLSPTSLTVTEGDSGRYTVALDTQPTGAVTVEISGHAGSDLTVTPTSLTFNSSGSEKLWNVAQEVVVTVSEDDDTANDSVVTLAHDVSGGGYGSSEDADLEVTITDNDTPGLSLSPDKLTVEEGSSTNTYTVRLATQPTANVTVAITSDVTGVTVQPASLTFSASTPATLWSTAQEVTVTAAQDDTSTTYESATLSHTVSGAGSGYGASQNEDLVVTVTDTTEPEITIARSGGSGAITEGGTATFTVTADPVPAAALAVTLNIADVANADYLTTVRESATVMIPVGGTVTHNVVTSADSTDEPDGEITVTVTDGAGYTVGSGSSATVEVNDNDATTVTLTTPDAAATEGSSTQRAQIVLTLGRVLRADEILAVPLAFSGGVLGTDFTLALTTAATGVGLNATTGVVTFMGSDAGSATVATVTLTASHDADAEEDTITVTIPAAHTGNPRLTATNLGGGATGTVTANHGTITVDDDDTVGITFSPTSVTVAEEGSGSYTVVLDTQPSAVVTVTITSDSAELTIADTDGDTPSDQNTLTFNPTGVTKLWNVAQTVTVNAAADDDTANDAVMLTHAASGGDYASVSEDLAVTITDNDVPALVITPKSLTVAEGSSSGSTNTYTVRLATEPTADVTVTIGSDNADVTLDGPDSATAFTASETLTFSASGANLWSTAQTVTVSAAQDTDVSDDEATLTHTASDTGGYDDVTADLEVTVTDDDEPEITIARSGGSGAITEGGTATFTVTANPVPDANLEVTLNVADVEHADYLAPGNQGTKTVTVPVGGSVDYDVVTTGGNSETTDEPDGEITVTVNAGTGYTVSNTNGSETVEVEDDDATTVTLTTPTATATEDSSTATARLVLTLGRALRSGEVLAVPLGFSGGALNTDFTLALTTAATGVGLSGSTVTFTGSDAGSATVATVTLTASHDADAEDESITVTIPASHTGNAPILTATNLSGGAAGSRVGNGVITVSDDEERGITLSPTSLTVTEGDSGRYTVALDTQPTGAVTVEISGHAGSDLTVTPTSLTFNSSGSEKLWNVAQEVVVTVSEDDDTANDSVVTLAHDVSGGGYGSSEDADLEVTITDNDTPGLSLSPDKLTVEEGSSTNTYTVRLATQPTANVTVAITSDVTGVTVQPASLTFSASTPATLWSTAQEVTVTAAQDDTSTTYESATLSHTVSGAGSGYGASQNEDLVVTVTDTTEPEITIARSGGSGAITEGGTATFTVTADPVPAAALAVTLNIADVANADYLTTVRESATVMIPVGGTVTHNVVTSADSTDEPDGEITVTVTDGAGYTVGSGSSATVEVNDNDATTVTLTTPDAAATEGSSTQRAQIVLTLGRVLRADEILAVPLAFSGGVLGTDFTLALTTAATGVGLNATTGVVTFMGSDAGSATVATVTLTASHDADAEEDTITVTIPAAHTGNPRLTATNLGGGATGTVTANHGTITVDDDDTVGITFSPTSVTVAEEGSGSYTVVLDTQPSAVVTVTITSDSAELTIADTDGDTPSDQNTLTFNPTGVTKLWNVAQTVTVNAAADDDTANDAVMLTHAASGGDYASVSEDLAVTITDNDVPALVITPKSLTVAEGSSSGSTNTYTVRLATEPTADVTVTIGSDNADVTLDGPDSATAFTASETLTFSASGANLWSTAQTVTVSAAQDTDVSDDEATLTHTASDTGGYDDVTADLEVTVTDDDEPEITIARSGGSGAITEGGTATFTVTANPVPDANLEVTLNVADVEHADYLAPGNQGTKTVTVPVGGSVDYDVVTTGGNSETTDEPDGEITVTVTDGAGYTVGTTGSAKVEVQDDDATPVTLTTPDTSAEEGSSTKTARIVLTLGRALRAGEVLAVPLAFSGGVLGTDFTLELTTADGVGLSGSTVTFSGSGGGSSTVATVTLKASQDDNATDETIPVTIPASSATGNPRLTATNLGGGATGTVTATHGTITVDDDDTVGITFSPTSVTVAEEGSGSYTVVLDTQPTEAVTVTITSDSAELTIADTDGDTPSDQNTLTFNPSGVTKPWNVAQTVTVNAAADVDTANDAVTLTHAASGGDYGSVSEDLEVTVTDDDTAPVASFATATGSYTEKAGAASARTQNIRVNFSAVLPTDITLNYSVTGTATAGADYTALTGTVAVSASATHVEIPIVVTDDTTDEAGETVILTLNNGTGYTVNASSNTHTLTLVDNDATTVTIAAGSDTLATEGDSNDTAQITLTLSRELYAGESLSTPISTTTSSIGAFTLALSGTPAGVTFSSSGSIVTFTGLDTGSARVATLNVTALDDEDADDETFIFRILLASGGLDGGVTHSGTASITLDDDDTRGLTLTSPTVMEGGSGTYTVKLDTKPSASVTVTITGHASTDLTLDTDSGTNGNQNTLTFNPTGAKLWSTAQPVTVTAAEDDDTTNDTVTLNHDVSGGGYTATEDEDLEVTITDNDVPVVTITGGAAIEEGGDAVFTVTANPVPAQALTVHLKVADAADSDFVLAAHEGAKTVTIPTGGTATYTVATDNGHSDTDEPNGAVTVTVNEDTADPDTYTVGSTATASVAVRDNDETTVTLARSGGSGAIAEGGSATLTVTLGRALVAGEEITAPLTVSGEGIAAGDYTVALDSGASLNRGVTLNTSNPHSAALPAVVFAGHGTQTVQVATLTLTAVNDEVDEGVSETLTVGFGSGNRAVMSNLDRASGTGTGGTAASGTVAVEITDNDTAATTLVLTPATIDESGAGNASTVTATLSRASSVATTLTVSATAVAPAVSGDFTVSANKTLTIAAGAKASTGVVTITAVDNKVDAANKKVTVSAVASGGHGLANPGNQELTITDDDERGITFDPEESVSVIEEGSGSYTVVLDTQPTEAVTVTITSDNGDLTIADTDSVMQGIQNTLTFNPTGVTKLWNVAQTVTVNAAADDDTANDAVMLTHAASGGDYASVSEDLAVTITDNDVPALVITPKSLTVAEGSSSGSTNTYTVRLATEPTADVTVTIGSDNADVTLDGPDSATAFTASETLTFSASGANLWSTAQTVTVSAAQDTDVSDDEATLTHTASDTGGYDDVTADLEVTVTDDDEPEITIARSGGSGAITEGDTATFTVTANPVPAGNLVVTLNVADVEHADYLAPGNQGTKTVTVPVGGSVDYDVVTTGGNSETTDEPDGEITVTVNAGTGYTVSNTNGSETVEVEDDDATTVTLTTPTATATEDSSTATARLVLTLGRALRSGEVLAVPLGFSGGALNTDFTLALTTAATGVGLSGSTVTFTGSDAGSATVATVTLTASHDADAEDESITVTIPASHTGNAPILTATNLSGGAAGSRVGNGVITVSDDEERGITLSPTSLTVTEGDSGRYTVALDTQPTGAVTVEISGHAGSDLTVTPTSLTFNSSGSEKLWNVAQEVVVTVSEDDDTANDSVVTLAHDVSGGGYGSSEDADLEVTITDNDTPGLSLSPDKLTVEEGSSTNTYTVRLATQPTANVTVAITSDVTGVTVQPASLTFSASTPATLWSTAQEVTVTAAQDDTSTTYESATLSHTVSGAGSGYGASQNEDLVVTVTDTTEPEITIARSGGSGAITEGGTATFTVTADPVPAAALAVTLNIADVANADYLTTVRESATVMIPVGGTVTHNVVTSADSTDEPDGEITVTVTDGAGYTVGSGSSATVEVNDNDATTVTLTTPDAAATEGSSTQRAQIVLTLGRVLRADEILAVPLAFSGGVLGTDFTLALTTAATGVGLNATTGVVTFMGSDAGSATVATVTLTASHDADAEEDTITVTIPAAHTGNPRLTATNLGGGATGTVTANHGTITVDDDDTVGITFSPTSVTVAEEGSGSYTVVLDTQPSAVVTVTIASDNTDLTIADTDSGMQGIQNTLTFNPSGSKLWSDPQTVTVNAAADVDTANDEVTLTHAASGDYASVSEDLEVTITDNDTAGLVIAPSSLTVAEGSSSGSTNTYTVRLATEPTADVTVTIESNNTDVTLDGPDSATAFTASETLTFSPSTPATLWSTAQTVTVSAAQDVDVSDDEATLTHTASNTGGYNGVTGEVAVTVTDDDEPEITIARTSGATLTEGGTATFRVTANPVPATNLAVTLNIADVANADYLTTVRESATVTVPTSGSVVHSVVTSADTTDEPDGDITVTVNTGTGYTVGTTDSATVAVTDNDATTVTLTTPDASATEGNSTQTARLVLTLGRALRAGEVLAVPLGFSGGALNTDFTLALTTAATGVGLSGSTVTFTGSDAGSATVATVTLTASHDADAEEDTITVTIPAAHTGNAPILTATNLSGGAAGSRVGNGVITVSDDEERGITLSPTSLTVTEGGTNTYTVRLATQPSANVTVAIASDVTGVTVQPASLTFSASGANLWSTAQTVTVSAAQDVDVSDDEATLTHTASNTGGYNGVTADLKVMVTDDDEPEITIARTSGASVTEGGTATFRVTADPVPAANLAVTLTIADVEHADYLTPSRQSATVMVPTGGSVVHSVVTTADTTDEPDGEITVTVNAGTGYTVSNTNGSETVEVEDDDATTVTLTTPTATATEDSSTATARLVLTLGRALAGGRGTGGSVGL